jgi:hypothetical protein
VKLHIHGDVVDSEIIQEHRTLLRQVLLARDAHVRLTGHGPRARYGIVLLSGVSGFRLVTPHDSLGCYVGIPPVPGASKVSGLTAGMVMALSRGIVYVQGSSPAIVEPPVEDADPDQLVGEVNLLLMLYPHAARPPIYSSFSTTVFPEHLEYEPLVLTMAERPEGWPP